MPQFGILLAERAHADEAERRGAVGEEAERPEQQEAEKEAEGLKKRRLRLFKHQRRKDGFS